MLGLRHRNITATGSSYEISTAGAASLFFTRWRRVGYAILASTLLALWVAGTPLFANWLTRKLESQFPPISIDSLPQSDAVIVLGGIIGQPFTPSVSPDLGD